MDLIQKEDWVFKSSKDNFMYFIRRKFEDIGSNNLIILLEKSLVKDDWAFSYESLTLAKLIKEADNEFRLSGLPFFDGHWDEIEAEFDLNSNSLDDFIDLYALLGKQHQKIVKAKIENSLEERFTSKLYYSAVMKEIIPYESFFDSYLKTIPKNEFETSFREMFSGNEDKRNSRLNDLINLAYANEINLNNPAIQCLSDGYPYYEWLLNLEEFDYERFNPYWLLEYKTSVYFKKFRAIPQIKKKLLEAILDSKAKGLVEVYFQIFESDFILN